MTMFEDLRQAASPPPPAGFTPGIIYSGTKPSEITTPWLDHELKSQEDFNEVARQMGVPLPDGYSLQLVEAKFNQAAWHRNAEDIKEKHTAYTAPMWLYRFKVVLSHLGADKDIAVLAKEAQKKGRGKPLTPKSTKTTMVINLADFQVGKVDALGGTAELLDRSEIALAQVIAQVRKVRPAEIVLVDVGDSTEGFESAPNAAQMNDLSLTEQIRAWRRIFVRWAQALAPLVDHLEIVAVPSNHCRVRKGKNAQSHSLDDWGIEVLAQVQEIFAETIAYEHVEFWIPNEHEEHVTLTLLGGKVISFAHGHQCSNPKQLTEWAKKQGRRPIGMSDIVVVGHFHHLRVEAYGENQYLFCCPTMDSGSSWFTPSSGEVSRPGVLTFVVDEFGWRDLLVAWA